MKIPNTYEIILLLIGLNNNSFSGKTNIHKNLYLIKEMMSNINNFPYSFKPYFYGPFSYEISNSLDTLVSVGLLKTNEIDYGDDESFGIKKNIYELSKTGEEANAQIKTNYKDFYDMFYKYFMKLKDTNYHQNTRILATAAKIRLILSQERRSLNQSNIKEKAKELGWKIENRDIDSAIDILLETGLAKKS